MELQEVASAIESMNRRLDAIWDDQRRIIEKLNRLRLVVDAIRNDQSQLALKTSGAGAED